MTNNFYFSDLTPEQIKELKRREKDSRNPIRYAVFHSFTQDKKFILWHRVENDTYCADIEQATLYKRYLHAHAIANSMIMRYKKEKGKKAKIYVYVAKITTEEKKLKVLMHNYHE